MDPFEELWGPPKTGSPGPLTLSLLKHFEGYTPKPKWDSKQYSVGYSTRWEPGMPIGSREDHEAALQREAGQAGSWLDRNVKTPLDDTKRAVLTSAGYNLGTGEKGLGRLLPDINAGDWNRVAERLRTFNRSDGAVNPGLVSRRNIEADMLLGRAGPPMGGAAPTQGRAPMDDPFEELWGPQGKQRVDGNPMQPPRAQPPQMPTPGNSMVPGIFGGGDQPGYFGRLFSDPTFLTGASVLSGGLAGQDFGTALQRGTQAGVAANEMHIRRQKHAAWGRIFGKDGPNMNAPLLKGVPPDIIPIVQAMGPDDGMDALTKLAFKRLSPRQLTPVAPGASLYDEQAGREVFRAPMNEKPPSGYRDAGGGSLEAIPGGPATVIPGDQAGRLAAIQTAKSSYEDASNYFAGMGWGRVNKVLNRGDAGRAERTISLAIESALRAMTGAAAPPAEVENYKNMFAPSAWDTTQTMTDKMSRLKTFIDNAEANLRQGRGASPQQPGQPQQRRAPSADDPLGILD